MPVFETLRERLAAAASHGSHHPDGAAAASVAAALHFSRGVGEVLGARADAAAAAGDPAASLVGLSRAIWELVGVYFVEPGGGTGVVTEQLVDWFQRNAASLDLGPEALPKRIHALVAAITEAGPTPEDAPGYWECFASMIALG